MLSQCPEIAQNFLIFQFDREEGVWIGVGIVLHKLPELDRHLWFSSPLDCKMVLLSNGYLGIHSDFINGIILCRVRLV